MKILVATASRYGATSEIAAAIGRAFEVKGIDVDVMDVDHVDGLEPYDVVVLGSAVYMGKWLGPARAFVKKHAAELADRPTWLFSSGPIGSPLQPNANKAVQIDSIIAETGAIEHRVFAGKLDKRRLGRGARALVRAVHAPYGDFRPWAEITAWTDEIVEALRTTPSRRDPHTRTALEAVALPRIRFARCVNEKRAELARCDR